MGRDHKHISKLKGYIKPSAEMRKKAKHSLGIPLKQKLPRCLAKSQFKVKAFERAGDFSHSADDHLCDECRCKYEAGYGTSHLGIGFCLPHTCSNAHKNHAPQVAEAHKIAIRQGYPDKAYTYAVSNPEGYVARIREAAEAAGGMTDLREEVIIVRNEVQRLLEGYERGEFKKTVKIVEGTGRDRTERFEQIECDDLDKVKALTALTRVLGKLSIDNLRLTDDDVVTYDQVKMWAAGTLNLVEKALENEPEVYRTFVGDFAKLFETVNVGRGRKTRKASV